MALLLNLLFASAAVIAAPEPTDRGKLVVVGGRLEADNSAVFEAFLEGRPKAFPSIAIIPAASGEPAMSAQRFREDLVRHGMDAADIEVVHLALEDDAHTPDVDEGLWAGNASNDAEIAKIARAGAIWFTGGDQSRIVEALVEPSGGATPMLRAIMGRHEAGATLGGTSAGAAIMSNPMIASGDTLKALGATDLGEDLVLARGLGFLRAIMRRHEAGATLGGTSAGAAIMSNPMIASGDTLRALGATDLGEDLVLARGLGFLRGVIVDQHFGERARLGRLAEAISRTDTATRIGVGIDENTALVVAPDGKASVVGSGYVTLLDAQEATRHDDARVSIEGLLVGMAGNGDTIDLSSVEVSPAPYRNATIGAEYFEVAQPAAGGMAVAGNRLDQVIGEALLDNGASTSVTRHSVIDERGVSYRFNQTPRSQGWWGRAEGGSPQYTIDKVTFDILPIDVDIKRKEAIR